MSGVMINNNNQVGLAGVGKGVEVGKEFTCASNNKKSERSVHSLMFVNNS